MPCSSIAHLSLDKFYTIAWYLYGLANEVKICAVLPHSADTVPLCCAKCEFYSAVLRNLTLNWDWIDGAGVTIIRRSIEPNCWSFVQWYLKGSLLLHQCLKKKQHQDNFCIGICVVLNDINQGSLLHYLLPSYSLRVVRHNYELLVQPRERML